MTMLSLIFGALVAQSAPPSGFPDSYIGLYADRNDRCYVMASGTSIEYIDGDQWGVIAGIYQAPNKDYVGTWAQAKFLTTSTSNNMGMPVQNPGNWNRNWLKVQQDPYKAFGATYVGIFAPDNQRYTGEARFRFLSQSSFSASLQDTRGIDHNKTTLFYVGGYDKIRVGGVYKDKYSEVNITENWGNKRWNVEGTFSHLGKKYNIQGERLYTRGLLTLVDPTNGKYVGWMMYGYNPTRSQMKAFRGGDVEPCDTVLVNFVVPGSPTVQVKGLGR